MLPGLRFLLVAIVLSLSILVFGLGATALLRAAHEVFASDPSWRAAPETKIAQPNDARLPDLAMLQLDSPPAEPKLADQSSIPVPAAEPAADPAEAENLSGSPQTGTETAIAPVTADSSPPESAKPDISVLEARSDEADLPVSNAMADAAERPSRSLETTSGPGTLETEVVPRLSEQPSTPPSSPEIGPTRTANTDAPSATLETQPQVIAASRDKASTTPDRSLAKKRLQERRAAERRRMAFRARMALQAQQQALVQPVVEPLTPAISNP
jgi:hypothetical protein